MIASPSIFFMAPPGDLQDWFWRGPSRQRAAELGYEIRLNSQPGEITSEQWAELLVGVEALLTTWGSPRIDEALLGRNSTLKIVGHVGGSVAGIASPALYDRGIRLCTANRLMARSVAEWSLMMTLVGLRGLLDYSQFGTSSNVAWERRKTNLVPADAAVGIWGYGDVAKWLIELLRPFELKGLMVSDEHLTANQAAAAGIRKVALDDLFGQADVVHCLTSLTAANKGAVGAPQLAAIRDQAVLINCGRAALVQEEDLIAELAKNRFTAIMDVFETEPLADDHPYRSMPNVILTPHNAGYGRDAHYLGAMLEEFDRFFRGEPLLMEVELDRALGMTDSSLTRKVS